MRSGTQLVPYDGQILNAAQEASNVLGFKWLKGGCFPDNAMDSVPILEIIKAIEEVKLKISPLAPM